MKHVLDQIDGRNATAADLDRAERYVRELCARRFRMALRELLLESPQGLTLAAIALALDLHRGAARRLLMDMLGRRAIAVRVPEQSTEPLWVAVTVGACEWCGLIDHELVLGACPQCRTRAITMGDY